MVVCNCRFASSSLVFGCLIFFLVVTSQTSNFTNKHKQIIPRDFSGWPLDWGKFHAHHKNVWLHSIHSLYFFCQQMIGIWNMSNQRGNHNQVGVRNVSSTHQHQSKPHLSGLVGHMLHLQQRLNWFMWRLKCLADFNRWQVWFWAPLRRIIEAHHHPFHPSIRPHWDSIYWCFRWHWGGCPLDSHDGWEPSGKLT